jgi:hypothetical protein
VSVTLERGRDDAGGALGQALDDAVEILAGGLGIAIRGAAVLLPLAVIGVLAWLAAGSLRRRRREAILR